MLITGKELCQELRISYSTLVRIVSRGELPFLRIGSALRFRREDVDLYLERSRTIRQAPRAVSHKKTAPPGAPKNRSHRSEAYDMEEYKAAGIYIPGRPYVPGMKIVIPPPEALAKGGEAG